MVNRQSLKMPPDDFVFTVLLLFLFFVISVLPCAISIHRMLEGSATTEDIERLICSIGVGVLILKTIGELTDWPMISRYRKQTDLRQNEWQLNPENLGGYVTLSLIHEHFSHLAKELRGVVTSNFFYPQIQGVYRGRKIDLALRHHRKGYVLHIHFDVPHRWTLKIVRSSMFRRMRSILESGHLSLWPNVISPSLILSGDLEHLRAWLSHEPEQLKEHLTFLFDVCHAIRVEMQKQKMALTLRLLNPTTETSPQSLLLLLNVLYDLSQKLGGIIVTNAMTQEIRCPFCKDPLPRSDRTVCQACKTAYHSECWKITDRCSVFGCTGQRSEPLERF